MSNKLLDQNYQIPKLNSPPNIKANSEFIFRSVSNVYWLNLSTLILIHRTFVVKLSVYSISPYRGSTVNKQHHK